MCGCNEEVKSVYCGEGDCVSPLEKESETHFIIPVRCSNCNFRTTTWIEKGCYSADELNNRQCRICLCPTLVKDF